MTVPASRAPALAIRGPIAREDLPGLYARVCSLLERHAGAEIVCDVAGVPADAVAVDALARLQLGARRHACRVRLLNPSTELRELVGFMGLGDVLAGW